MRCAATDYAANHNHSLDIDIVDHARRAISKLHRARHMLNEDIVVGVALGVKHVERALQQSLRHLWIPFSHDNSDAETIQFWQISLMPFLGSQFC